MSRRRIKGLFRSFNAEAAQAMVGWMMAELDKKAFDALADTPNGSARLVAFHDAVSDADDTLEAVGRAICDGDLAEASKLIALGRDSLKDRITELKELL